MNKGYHLLVEYSGYIKTGLTHKSQETCGMKGTTWGQQVEKTLPVLMDRIYAFQRRYGSTETRHLLIR